MTEEIDYRHCYRCKEEKKIEEFCINGTRCRICDNEVSKIYRSTLNGFLQKLISGSRVRSKRKKSEMKLKTAIHTITKDDLLGLYNKQDKKCYYSGITMKHIHHANWMMSIERLNNNEGYTKENTVLCCYEFNSGKSQWTLEKIDSITKLINIEIDVDTLQLQIDEALINPSRKGVLKNKYIELISDDNTEKMCHVCKEFYPINNFIKNPYMGCKKCRTKRYNDYNSTLRGFIINLVGAARSRTTKNNKKGRDLEFDITYIDIFDLIISQKGRCFYSEIPLMFAIKSDWMCSIERLDNNTGYVKENIVLICNEFNTSSTIGLAACVDEITGSSQWTKEKFKYFFSHINQQPLL